MVLKPILPHSTWQGPVLTRPQDSFSGFLVLKPRRKRGQICGSQVDLVPMTVVPQGKPPGLKAPGVNQMKSLPMATGNRRQHLGSTCIGICILWIDEIHRMHHLESMRNHGWSISMGESSFRHSRISWVVRVDFAQPHYVW